MASLLEEEVEKIVICGAGIVGWSTAYFLTQLAKKSGRAVKPIVVDRVGTAACASGKAAGFLAGNWGNAVTAQLHEEGFKLHRKLAESLGVQSYRDALPTWAVAPGAPLASVPKEKLPAGTPDWLDGAVRTAQLMDSDTAQVLPRELAEKLMNAAMADGAELRIGKVEGVYAEGASGNRKVTSVKVDGDSIACDKVLVALGPWSVLAEQWFENLRVPMVGTLGTSSIFKQSAGSVALSALFCEEDDRGRHIEVFSRPNGEVYCVGGHGGQKVLTAQQLMVLPPEEIEPDAQDARAARAAFSSISSIGQGTPPSTLQACVRPCTLDGLPLMGDIPGYDSTAFLACGHSCWGILWGPISGLAMAELILLGESTSLDLSAFDVRRTGPRM
mmetsp:Transcript_15823/g.28493  ORF Transcript_15823/g.28493 Transcript_15823/m.28493 type:complete len:387 (-) Transcript_15823:372-1532(-)